MFTLLGSLIVYVIILRRKGRHKQRKGRQNLVKQTVWHRQTKPLKIRENPHKQFLIDYKIFLNNKWVK